MCGLVWTNRARYSLHYLSSTTAKPKELSHHVFDKKKPYRFKIECTTKWFPKSIKPNAATDTPNGNIEHSLSAVGCEKEQRPNKHTPSRHEMLQCLPMVESSLSSIFIGVSVRNHYYRFYYWITPESIITKLSSLRTTDVVTLLSYSSFGVNLANAVWPIGRITAETNRVWERTNRIPDGKSRTCILRSHTVVAVSKTKNIFRSSKTTKFVSNKFQCHCRCRRFFSSFHIKNKNSRCEVNRKPRSDDGHGNVERNNGSHAFTQ